MDLKIKAAFTEKYSRLLPGAELPVTFYFTDNPGEIPLSPALDEEDWKCFICQLGRVRNGQPTAFGLRAIGCSGAKRALGFEQEIRPNFEYFLSCGLAGHIEGIRYKKTPALVKAIQEAQPAYEAPARYAVFKRWDGLEAEDEPTAVIFFAAPDKLSALFSLVNFDEPTPFGVIAPSCAGCSSIVYYPYHEAQKPDPKAVLGMFDISARPCVHPNILTLAVPYARFERLAANMDESFLIAEQWNKIRDRI
ncbi:MAG: DUF169 domain-containing protein [candidate division Zixibacteria bacterium]|nr:DUF169 domain-containing protein [candidate division Zixibacteria bacterium]